MKDIQDDEETIMFCFTFYYFHYYRCYRMYSMVLNSKLLVKTTSQNSNDKNCVGMV